MLLYPKSNRGSKIRDSFLAVPSLIGAPNPAAAKLLYSISPYFSYGTMTVGQKGLI